MTVNYDQLFEINKTLEGFPMHITNCSKNRDEKTVELINQGYFLFGENKEKLNKNLKI